MKNLKIFFILIVFSQLSLAQNRIVCGVVNDSTGLPIPGVNVLIEGKTHSSTTTDFNGNYSIKANSNDVIAFTYIGMIPLKIIANQNEINVILKMDPIIIYDLVPPDVVNPNKKRKELYNAIKTISAEDLKKGSPKS
jgi:hypothetical protein